MSNFILTKEPAKAIGSLFVFGTEEGRTLNKSICATSFIKLTLPDIVSFEKCKEELRLFSSVLRNRKAEDVYYGWDRIYCFPDNNEIAFKILWYSIDYFEKRKNAFKSILHQRIFKELKIEENSIHVEHCKTQ